VPALTFEDLSAARAAIDAGEASAAAFMEESLASADSARCARAFLHLDAKGSRASAAAVDLQRAAGLPLPALAGLAVSVKDLFDVAGQVTSAGSRILAGDAPASADCPAVARLRRAGAALIGRTNMTEFAFSGVGINPHHGTPVNAGTAQDPVPRIPGGSTSGGATSVAGGAAWAALGSDTGGSIRIPAALQGLVGFKPTARLIPTQGAIPLSPTLDTACAITRSVRDAQLLFDILAGGRPALETRALRYWRFGVVSRLMLEGMDRGVASAFERVLSRLRQQGASVEDIALPEIDELANINRLGGFAAAESWSWHRQRLAGQEAQYDPRVVLRMRRGQSMSAADYIELHQARRDWQQRVAARIGSFDALLSPTVPIVAPPLGNLASDDAAFFQLNALLLRNPSVVNFLDGCALSLPCQQPGELPVGLMVWHAGLRDDVVVAAAASIERALVVGDSSRRGSEP
jgi:Asp-tRNA(Asn)/Glu-tRNA(Gln) amidotransferase A subunit family amidase